MTSALKGEGVNPKADNSTDRLRDRDSDRGRASVIPKILLTSYANGPVDVKG